MTNVVERVRRDVDAPTREDLERFAAEDRGYVPQSLARSRERIDAALAQPCVEHDAEAGAYCWPGPRALCSVRFSAGVAELTARPAVLQPGELAPLATATRLAAWHRQQARVLQRTRR